MLLNPILCDEIIGGQHPGNSEPSRDAAAIGQIPVDWSAGGGRLDVSTSCLTIFSFFFLAEEKDIYCVR